ncbi:alpha/beta fold hydrolase [Halopseudomonas sp.]|uniref:alpha/beta fold hydrolase n=1 Tax=Halopseudomonas sp. TaxID=2901191 RepID=UPI0030036034
MTYATWQDFHAAQRLVMLPAGSVNHLDLSVRYIDTGSGKAGTILLMHGIPTWGFLYHAVIPLLAECGYRVIAPDFLGHGFSDKRDRFDRSFQDQARMILALLDRLGIERTHVVGHDTGGAVALILGIEHPAVVERLVISNAVCYDRFDDDMLDFGHPLRWKSKPVSALLDALDESLAMGLSDQQRLTVAFAEGIKAPWSDEEGKLSLLRNASALNANQTMALVDRHHTVTAPTLVLWGEDDPWQKVADGQQLASEIPGARFQLIQGASHWLQQDAPERFSQALLDFLAE